MTMSELSDLFKWIEKEKGFKIFYPGKYIMPKIDTRNMVCYSITFEPWHTNIKYSVDFRDDYTQFFDVPKDDNDSKISFYDYVIKFLEKELDLVSKNRY
jgi:spore coat polysaccharide biosynthesis protein SpsF (cytidylyltransferase family)